MLEAEGKEADDFPVEAANATQLTVAMYWTTPSLIVHVGEIFLVEAVATDGSGRVLAVGPQVTWSLSDTHLASAGPDTGANAVVREFTADAPGRLDVTAHVATLSATRSVTIAKK